MSSPRTSTDSPLSIERYLDDLTSSTSRGWNRFWFTPSDPATLGFVRILTGLMVLYTHWVWGLEFETFFGVHSWTSADVVRQFQAEEHAYSFWFHVPPELAWSVHLGCLGVLALFTLGVFTRVTSILAFVIVVSYANRVPTALFGLDQINGMLTLYCAIGPSGAAYSVDRLVRRLWRDDRRPVPSVGANLAIRLIQVHMCVIYLFAGLSKLQGDTWWNGLAMWFSFANREYQTMDMTPLAESPLLVNAMTHVTILWELSFCALIWNRLTRPLMLIGAILLHAGIGVCLGMWTFGLVMLIGCSAFLSPRFVRACLDRPWGNRR